MVAGVAILVASRSDRSASTAAQPAVPRERAVLDVRAGAVAISPDGRRCVTLDRAGTTSLWSCADGERLLRRRGVAAGASTAAVAFTRDGLGILAASGGKAKVLDPGDLRTVTSLRGPTRALAPVISPSGLRAFRPRSTHVAHIVDTGGGRRVVALRHIPDLARARVVFSRDDRSVAMVIRPRSWVTVFDATTGEPRNSFNLDAADASFDLSADGARVLIATGTTLRIMEVNTGVELERITAHGAVSSAAFGADERLIVAGEADGGVEVWDTADGAEVAEYAGGSGAVSAAALAADGRLLVSGSRGSPVVLECPACAPAA